MGADRQSRGFTLIEIILVIAAIGIIAAIVLLAINPNRQLSQARNIVRQTDINTIQKALEQYLIDNGRYPNSISTTPRYICNTGVEQVGGSTNCTDRADLRELVPNYIAGIPRDPQATGTNTGYIVATNPDNNRISLISSLSENKSILYNSFIVKNGLVLHLDAGNVASYPGTGTTWFDLSGNNNNGTLFSTSFNEDAGGSISFESSTSRVVGTSPLNFVGGGFTIELWIKHTGNVSTSRVQRYFTMTSFPLEGPVLRHNNSSNTSLHGYVFDNSNTFRSIDINNQIFSNVFYNLIYTYDGSDFRIYNNANQVGVLSNSIVLPTPGSSYLLGADWGEHFQGNMYSVRYYNRGLSLTEIQHNFNVTKGRFGF